MGLLRGGEGGGGQEEEEDGFGHLGGLGKEVVREKGGMRKGDGGKEGGGGGGRGFLCRFPPSASSGHLGDGAGPGPARSRSEDKGSLEVKENRI